MLSLSDILILQPSSKVYKEHYEDESLDFLVVGDWGDLGLKGDKNGELQRLVANAMEKYADKYNSKFIINVGDNFYEGGVYDYQGVKSVEDEKWKTIWLEVYKGKLSTIPWYSVAGNHDWYNNITAQIDYSLNKNPRFFLPSLYYVRTSVIGPTRTKIAWIHIDTDLFFYDYNKLDQSKKVMKENFLMMGWNLESAVEEKIKWIEQKLIENQDAKWILVVGHHPLIGSCIDNHYMYRLQPLFEKHRVTAYFAGHNHVLEYKGPQDFSPMAHFISGSGSRLSEGCKGKDWGIVKPGFLHVTISDKTGEMDFQFVDASEAKDTDGKVVFQGKLSPRPFWHPKLM
ncbi:hypothetical protein G9A89_015663 [Geosiphon pyriformis]|nr:hypothetical protein G9A89_015663 [Geosiphon pyriformis]